MEETTIKYDPTKSYKWEPSTEFTFNGNEYGYVLQYLKEKKAQLLRELEVVALYENKLVQAVEAGKAVEVEEMTKAPLIKETRAEKRKK